MRATGFHAPSINRPFRWLQGVSGLAAGVLEMVAVGWRAHPWSLAVQVLIQVVTALLPVALAWLTKQLFDLLGAVLRQGTAPLVPTARVLSLLAALVCLGALAKFTGLVGSFFGTDFTRRVQLRVQSEIYKKISGIQGLAPFESPRFQDTMQKAAMGAQMGTSIAIGSALGVLRNALTMIGFLGVLVTLNPWLAILAAVPLAPQVVLEVKAGRRRFQLSSRQTSKERRAAYFAGMLSQPGAAKELRLFALGEYFLDKYRSVMREIHDEQGSQALKILVWQTVLAISTSLTGGTILAITIFRGLAGQLSVGDVMLYSTAVASVQGALGGSVTAATSLNEGLLFFGHYRELMNFEQPLQTMYPTRGVPPLRHGIELRAVSFRYGDAHPFVLKGLNLFIPAGQCLALVGLNGAGKTTIVKLLTRLYDPTEGAILWDGTDLRHFDPAELRRRVGVIFQDFLRYELTVEENIALGDVIRFDDKEATREAARRAGIIEAIERMPRGFETFLSRSMASRESGVGFDLSLGQWQKLALARMFRRRADLRILDEPTAALDPEAECDVFDGFARLIHGGTSLVITHRFGGARIADRIVVLEEGRVTELGTHSELMALNGTYARLFSVQASRYGVIESTRG